ncbi:hypothetical protein [Actinocrinis sp.]|jgi:hypothetical protein|uniref:hypothetical protein n=1 Tax=Actinocrinis sp. TaxID=1920516 RepID=UPI0032C24351
MNAHAERFVLATRTSVTDRMLILGERHLRHVMRHWEEHDNTEQAHMALGGRAPADDPNVIPSPRPRSDGEHASADYSTNTTTRHKPSATRLDNPQVTACVEF